MTIVSEYKWPFFHFHLQKRKRWMYCCSHFKALAVTDMLLCLVWGHTFYFGESSLCWYSICEGWLRSWEETETEHGFCGWSFPLPQRRWSLRLVLRSEVMPFFTLACIFQAVIAPEGDSFQSRGRRILTSHMMLSLFLLSTARRGGEFTFLSDADERVVVCFRNGWVFSCEGWLTAVPRRGVCRLFGNWDFIFAAWN